MGAVPDGFDIIAYGTIGPIPAGFFAAVTAIYLVALFGSGQPYAGVSDILASITPVVIGGTVLSGGRGGMMGPLFGTYLVSLLNNLLNFLDVDTYVQLMVQGLIIVLAVSAYVENRRSVASPMPCQPSSSHGRRPERAGWFSSHRATASFSCCSGLP